MCYVMSYVITFTIRQHIIQQEKREVINVPTIMYAI